MKKDLIKKEYKKKIKLLNYYNQQYYNENISKIPDSEFDSLKRFPNQLKSDSRLVKEISNASYPTTP